LEICVGRLAKKSGLALAFSQFLKTPAWQNYNNRFLQLKMQLEFGISLSLSPGTKWDYFLDKLANEDCEIEMLIIIN
jgi:hypothetical protein